MHRPPSSSNVTAKHSPVRGKAANEVLGNKAKATPDKEQLSLTGQSISPRIPLPSPRRNSIGTASSTPGEPVASPTHNNNNNSNNTPNDKLRNLHGRTMSRYHSSGNLHNNDTATPTFTESPVSRTHSSKDTLANKISLLRSPSNPPINSPVSPVSPGLELHEMPTNYSMEEGNSTIEVKNEEDFASFLHKDAIQERYMTPTLSRRSRYDDLQISLDKEPPKSSSNILRTLDESDEGDIPENIDEVEGSDDGSEKLDEDLGLTTPRSNVSHELSSPRNHHASSQQMHSSSQKILPTQQLRPSSHASPRSALPGQSSSGRASFNVQEFKKSLHTFNKEHSLPAKKENGGSASSTHSINGTHHAKHVLKKHDHAARVIQKWWRQIKAERVKNESLKQVKNTMRTKTEGEEIFNYNGRTKLTQSGIHPEHKNTTSEFRGMQRPGSTPAQRTTTQPTLSHVKSDLSHTQKYRFGHQSALNVTPLNIPTANTPSTISPKNERSTNNRTPTIELHVPPRRTLSQSEGVARPDPISPRRPHSTSPHSTTDATSPHSTNSSGYESSGKMRTGTSSMNIFVDDDDRNKSRTPRLEAKVERNVLLLDRIAEEEDNVVLNDEDEEGQKKQLKQPDKPEEEEYDSGPDVDNRLSIEDAPDARSSAVEGARALGDEIGEYMELQRTLLQKEQHDARQAKRKKQNKLPFQIPLIHSPYSQHRIHPQNSPLIYSPFSSPQEPNLSLHSPAARFTPPGDISHTAANATEGTSGESSVEEELEEIEDLEEIEEFAETSVVEVPSSPSPPPQHNANGRDNSFQVSKKTPNITPTTSHAHLPSLHSISPPSTPVITVPVASSSIPRTPRTANTVTTTAPTHNTSTPRSSARVRSVHSVPPLDLHDLDSEPTNQLSHPQASPQNLTQHAYQNMPQNMHATQDPYNWDELLEGGAYLPRKDDQPQPQIFSQQPPTQRQFTPQKPTPLKPPTSHKPPTPQTSLPHSQQSPQFPSPHKPHTPLKQHSPTSLPSPAAASPQHRPQSHKQYTPTKYINQNVRGSSAESKLFNFLDYLEQQDDTAAIALPSNEKTPRSDVQNVYPVTSAGDSVVSGVKARIVSLEVEIADKSKTIDSLKNAIKQMKTKEQQILAESEQKLKDHTAAKQQEQQDVLQRHLKFIDRLMADKKELSEKCDALSKELQEIDKRTADKLKEAADQHARELKKHKDSWGAAEKIRRDSWMQEKTKEIKELTIKGLEPEIHKLLAKHKQESKALEDSHQLDLKKARDELAAAYEAQLQQWKLRMLNEHKADIEKEREKNKQAFKDNSESQQDMLQQQARRLAQEFRDERQKLEDVHRNEKLALDEKIMRMKNNEELLRSKMKDHLESNYQDLIRKHQTEISVIKEKNEIERDQWMSRTMTKLQQEAKQREEELREKLAKERDEEIEVIIAKFEEEHTTSHKADNRAHEDKMNSLKDKHSSHINELKESEKAWKTKYMEAVKTATEKDDKLTETKIKAAQLETVLMQRDEKIHLADERNQELRAKIEKQGTASNQQISALRDKHVHELEKLQSELNVSKIAHSTLEGSYQSEVTELEKRKNNELEQLHERVKAAIGKKDNTIQGLTARLQMAELRAQQLEQQLDRQRAELLG